VKAVMTIVLAAALTLAAAGAGFAQTSAPVQVTLKALNGSGEDGTATLAQTGDGVTVTISVQNGTTAPQPAHIHTGTCENAIGVAYPLSNVVAGKSTTTLKNLSLTSLQTGGFSINVHKSAAEIGTYVSCGDIPK